MAFHLAAIAKRYPQAETPPEVATLLSIEVDIVNSGTSL